MKFHIANEYNAYGGSALALLAWLEGFDVARLDEADRLHVIVEATKIAFEDRNRWLADPSVVVQREEVARRMEDWQDDLDHLLVEQVPHS